MLSSLALFPQRRKDRPPPGDSLEAWAGRGGQSEALEEPSLGTVVLPDRRDNQVQFKSRTIIVLTVDLGTDTAMNLQERPNVCCCIESHRFHRATSAESQSALNSLLQLYDPRGPSSSEQKLETLEQLDEELSFLVVPVDKRPSSSLGPFTTTVSSGGCDNSPQLPPGSSWAEAEI